ncbi:MAG: hypothetical protein K2G37_00595 [Clostridia bacterium]|nr:hypothetical protein [Clostridia bacterium]MDE7328152.1 hypothetical protein [Clostridia bacterium]
MYGIYGDIIDAANRALVCLADTQELLEYPEVQADKAYYLSILSKYNNLKFLQENLSALISTLEEEKSCTDMLADARFEDESAVIYQEMSSLRAKASKLAALISQALGCKNVEESAYCRFKLKEGSSRFGASLFALIKSDLIARGAKISDEKINAAKGGYAQEICFSAQGVDVVTLLSPLVGAHKVYFAQGRSEELCFAVTPSARIEKISENDLKIDVFHSSGAGGQNINKVETAVRVTHLPTGLSVVCQDERSQLKNKKRALDTIEKRLREINEQAEKRRIEGDIYAQYSKKNTPLSFDAVSNTMSDTRLKAFLKIKFPPTSVQFTQYINGLLAL